MKSFVENGDQVLGELIQSIQSRDREQIAVYFHKYKGMIANLYHDEFCLFLNQSMEELGQKGEVDDRIIEIITSFHSDSLEQLSEFLTEEIAT